jgi:CspA family cold shock protein
MGNYIGRVVTFDQANGHGFIRRGGTWDMFLHHSLAKEDGHPPPNMGDLVAFDIAPGTKGPQAVNVFILSRSHG